MVYKFTRKETQRTRGTVKVTQKSVRKRADAKKKRSGTGTKKKIKKSQQSNSKDPRGYLKGPHHLVAITAFRQVVKAGLLSQIRPLLDASKRNNPLNDFTNLFYYFFGRIHYNPQTHFLSVLVVDGPFVEVSGWVGVEHF